MGVVDRDDGVAAAGEIDDLGGVEGRKRVPSGREEDDAADPWRRRGAYEGMRIDGEGAGRRTNEALEQRAEGLEVRASAEDE